MTAALTFIGLCAVGAFLIELREGIRIHHAMHSNVIELMRDCGGGDQSKSNEDSHAGLLYRR